MSQRKTLQNAYHVVLIFPRNVTRTVVVKAATRETAERRALKRNPAAIDIKA